MRTLPIGLCAAVQNGAATLATVFVLIRTDERQLGFTDHDRDLVFDDLTCFASTGWTLGAADSALGFDSGTASATAALDSAAITEADIAAGLYDGAGVEAYRLDWTAPAERVLLWRGTIARMVRAGQGFTAEIEGPLALLRRMAGRTYARLCDADLGDGRCRADVSGAAFNGAGTLLGSTDGRRLAVGGLTPFAAGWFAEGRLVWTSGANLGVTGAVAAHLIGEGGVALVLTEPPPRTPAAGDGFTVRAGCDKTYGTCGAKFANTLNFQSFPDIPGDDFLTVNAANAPITDGSSRGMR